MSVHVRSNAAATSELALTTHSLIVFAPLEGITTPCGIRSRLRTRHSRNTPYISSVYEPASRIHR